VPNEWIPAVIANGGTARIDGWFIDSTGGFRPYPRVAAASLALGGAGRWIPCTYSLVDGMLSAESVQIDPGPPVDYLMNPVAWPGSSIRQCGGAAWISGVLSVGTSWIINADETPVAGTLQIGGNWWWQVDGTLPPEAGMSSDVAMEVVWPGEGLYELRAGEIAPAAGHGGACHSSPLIGTCAE